MRDTDDMRPSTPLQHWAKTTYSGTSRIPAPMGVRLPLPEPSPHAVRISDHRLQYTHCYRDLDGSTAPSLVPLADTLAHVTPSGEAQLAERSAKQFLCHPDVSIQAHRERATAAQHRADFGISFPHGT